ncbi:Hypothetical predicted protein, partial [Prunus dulcis]
GGPSCERHCCLAKRELARICLRLLFKPFTWFSSTPAERQGWLENFCRTEICS